MRLHRRLMATGPMVTLRAQLKDWYWAVKGRALRNPAVPVRPTSLLFVCKGNICRSPYAAARAGQLLTEAGFRNVRCGSAGIVTTQAAKPPHDACSAAKSAGLTLESHRPAQLTAQLLASYDMTFVMEAAQLVLLRERFPEAAGRVFLLPLFDRTAASAYARHNITDPFGHPLAAFEDCYRRIDEALRGLLAHLASGARPAVGGSRQIQAVGG